MLDTLKLDLAAARACADLIVADPLLDDGQRELLRAFLARARAARIGVVADPVALLYLIAAAEGVDDRRALDGLAAGCTFYYLALRLFDDVEDDELGPPWAAVGPAIATHAALTLYTLAVDAILDATPPAARDAARRVLRDRSLIAAAAQHRDLAGAAPGDAAAVLAQGAAKSSVFALIAELAAIACGCPAERVAAYRRIGEATCTMRQVANDIRDIYGKRASGDLACGRVTVPIAAFHARADAAQRAELARLTLELPGSLEPIRRLLLAAGAIQAAAAAMEAARRQIHADVLAARGPGGPLDLYRAFVDAMAGELYRPPAVLPAPVHRAA